MALNAEKWGRMKARERYGNLDKLGARPADTRAPQKLGDANNLQDNPIYKNDTPDNWLRADKESAEGKPDFDHGPVHGRR